MRNTTRPGTPEFEFVGELEHIAETKFKANLHGSGEEWEDALFAEYKAAGSPKPMNKWITERIKNEFKSMDKPPKWVDFETSKWPFHKGKPMVFLGEIPLKKSKDLEGFVDGGSVAYIFGLQDTGKHGEAVMAYQGQTLTKW